MFKEIGDELRRAREARGLSLRDIQAETKIRLRYLEALEDGDFSVIPGEVYARGFLRSYAQQLGLNSEEIMDRYRQSTGAANQGCEVDVTRPAASAEQPGLRVSHRVREGLARANSRPRENTSRAGFYLAVMIMVALVGAVVSFFYLGSSPTGSKLAPDGQSGVPSPPGQAQPRESPPAPAASSGRPQADPSLPDNQTRRQAQGKIQITALPVDPYKPFLLGFEVLDPAAAPLKLDLRTGVRCWYEVTADGHVVATGILEPGGKGSWEAMEKFSLRLGDPRQLEVSLNGSRLAINSYNEPVTIEAVRKR